MIFKNTGKHSRVNKLSFNDVVCYLYDYCFNSNTKSKVVVNLNYDNNLNVYDSNYQKKKLRFIAQPGCHLWWTTIIIL